MTGDRAEGASSGSSTSAATRAKSQIRTQTALKRQEQTPIAYHQEHKKRSGTLAIPQGRKWLAFSMLTTRRRAHRAFDAVPHDVKLPLNRNQINASSRRHNYFRIVLFLSCDPHGAPPLDGGACPPAPKAGATARLGTPRESDRPGRRGPGETPETGTSRDRVGAAARPQSASPERRITRAAGTKRALWVRPIGGAGPHRSIPSPPGAARPHKPPAPSGRD